MWYWEERDSTVNVDRVKHCEWDHEVVEVSLAWLETEGEDAKEVANEANNECSELQWSSDAQEV